MKNLFSKIFGSFVIIVVVLTALILGFSFRSIRSHYLESLEEELRNLNATFNLAASDYFDDRDFAKLDSAVKKLGLKIHVRITIIDTTGVVLADSDEDPRHMDNHKNRPEVVEAIKTGFGKSLRFSATVKENMLYAATPIEREGRIVGITRTSLYVRNIDKLTGDLKNKILQITVIVLFFSLFGMLVFSKNITDPINRLAKASQKVAAGDFDAKVFLKSDDEIRKLADSFNNMTDQIKRLFDEVSLKKEELNSVLAAMNDGLFTFDEEGRILLCNRGMYEIIGDKNIVGRFYWQALRERKFVEFIKKSINDKESFSEEIVVDGKFYLFGVNFIENKNEFVATLYNIDEIKKLDLVKKDFVMNVSHELRTPLTAIKGFIETMFDDVDDDHRQYLEIINRHTDRLIHIVQDLLLLSKTEDASARLEIGNVNLKSLAKNAISIYEQKFKEKNLEFEFIADEDLPIVKADAFKLEQVFINLIDNAVKYSDDGKLTLKVYAKNGGAIIEMKDTGIGISKENQKRVFERFYTVDKSRSRKLGGTGLGLSLVKHIAALHGGRIDLESATGQGSKFIFSFPIKN